MIEDELNKEKYGNKEDGFILDCINKEKSTMKDYVALYDNHLKTFFSSDVISISLSLWCKPIDGSSSTYNIPVRGEPICVASLIRCASPPDNVSALLDNVR